MNVIRKTFAEVVDTKEDFITIDGVAAGFKAMHVEWDDELDQFIPIQTSYFGYPTKKGTLPDALEWASACELPYVE